jgi:hypothetical protein
VLLVAGVVGGGAAVASVGPFAESDEPHTLTYQDASAHFGNAHGTTRDGRTFGGSPWTLIGPDETHVDALGESAFPDLVAVTGDHGKAGYGDRRALEADSADPCGIVAHPVYDTDGRTKLDTFTVGPGRSTNLPGWSVKGTVWDDCK